MVGGGVAPPPGDLSLGLVVSLVPFCIIVLGLMPLKWHQTKDNDAAAWHK